MQSDSSGSNHARPSKFAFFQGHKAREGMWVQLNLQTSYKINFHVNHGWIDDGIYSTWPHEVNNSATTRQSECWFGAFDYSPAQRKKGHLEAITEQINSPIISNKGKKSIQVPTDLHSTRVQYSWGGTAWGRRRRLPTREDFSRRPGLFRQVAGGEVAEDESQQIV